ncbi:MAG: LysR family transcriptional regulator [Thermodesulfobacteriota bacterium]|nr:LysR family transcriptional regulator [Thermodesulfobacteriota bacterium]
MIKQAAFITEDIFNSREYILHMPVDSTAFHMRSKMWIENEQGKVVFGLGRYRILDSIQRLGSLNAAAQELKMSYRAIWGRITATEDRIGKPLLVRGSRGSSLTPLAESLLKQFRRMRTIVEAEADEVFKDLMAAYLDG